MFVINLFYLPLLTELFLTSSKEGNRLEDQLSDYQPPKQYVKKEEKESRASPTVFITVNNILSKGYNREETNMKEYKEIKNYMAMNEY